MHRLARLPLALAGWICACSAYAHPGTHAHAHPHHLDLYVIVLLLAVVAGIAVWAVRQARRSKRPPSA